MHVTTWANVFFFKSLQHGICLLLHAKWIQIQMQFSVVTVGSWSCCWALYGGRYAGTWCEIRMQRLRPKHGGGSGCSQLIELVSFGLQQATDHEKAWGAARALAHQPRPGPLPPKQKAFQVSDQSPPTVPFHSNLWIPREFFLPTVQTDHAAVASRAPSSVFVFVLRRCCRLRLCFAARPKFDASEFKIWWKFGSSSCAVVVFGTSGKFFWGIWWNSSWCARVKYPQIRSTLLMKLRGTGCIRVATTRFTWWVAHVVSEWGDKCLQYLRRKALTVLYSPVFGLNYVQTTNHHATCQLDITGCV